MKVILQDFQAEGRVRAKHKGMGGTHAFGKLECFYMFAAREHSWKRGRDDSKAGVTSVYREGK